MPPSQLQFLLLLLASSKLPILPLLAGSFSSLAHMPTETPPKLEGVALLRSILTDIEHRQKRDKAKRWIELSEAPPDEFYFQPLLSGLNSE